VGGNASIQDTTRNALSIIDHLGLRDISVYQGEQHPFEGCFENAYAVHGSNGLGISLPEPTSTPSNTTAHQFITETAAVKRNNLLVITLGPLTNLALALQAEDRLAHWISRVIVMGGAVRVPGNITPYAEFNVYNDPTSAEVVFNSGIPITLIGLDVTMKTSFSEAEYPWVCGESANAHLARRILKSRFRSLQKGSDYKLHDPLAVIATIKPNILQYQNVTIEVEKKGPERGHTTAVQHCGMVKLAVTVDDKAAKNFMVGLLSNIQGT